MATGGGAFKYYDRIKEALGIEVQREDEMECLIIGMKCTPHISKSEENWSGTGNADAISRP